MGKVGRPKEDLLLATLEWGERLKRVCGGVSYDDFLKSEILQLAVSKCIEGIGEIAGRFLRDHPEFVTAHPELKFSEAYRMRNRLSHAYDTVDLRVVWRTIQDDVPELMTRVRGLLSGRGS
jgi:uncharacterized protein with HEPN domain